MTPLYYFLSIVVGFGGLSGLISMVRVNIRKETVTQQAELIEALRREVEHLGRQNDEQQDMINGLQYRVKTLEADLARATGVV